MPKTIARLIIMGTPMARQIDAGRKTRTFRLPTSMWANVKMRHDAGDRVLLWVRETRAQVGMSTRDGGVPHEARKMNARNAVKERTNSDRTKYSNQDFNHIDGLMKTCQKLGVSFFDYLGHRLEIQGAQHVPPLPDLVLAAKT